MNLPGEYYIGAFWDTGFTISALGEPKRDVVVLVFGNSWYALACDGQRGEMWPVRPASESHLAQLAHYFLGGTLTEREEVALLLQFVWEGEFMPLLFTEEP